MNGKARYYSPPSTKWFCFNILYPRNLQLFVSNKATFMRSSTVLTISLLLVVLDSSWGRRRLCTSDLLAQTSLVKLLLSRKFSSLYLLNKLAYLGYQQYQAFLFSQSSLIQVTTLNFWGEINLILFLHISQSLNIFKQFCTQQHSGRTLNN